LTDALTDAAAWRRVANSLLYRRDPERQKLPIEPNPQPACCAVLVNMLVGGPGRCHVHEQQQHAAAACLHQRGLHTVTKPNADPGGANASGPSHISRQTIHRQISPCSRGCCRWRDPGASARGELTPFSLRGSTRFGMYRVKNLAVIRQGASSMDCGRGQRRSRRIPNKQGGERRSELPVEWGG
jgi:hypothetical protein